jgi:hypothetical protein
MNARVYNHDLDGDGKISKEELEIEERMLRLENADKMQDQQRLMAWAAMASSIVTVIVLLLPILDVSRMQAAGAFLNTFLVAQTSVVIGFMGATAWTRKKENGNGK